VTFAAPCFTFHSKVSAIPTGNDTRVPTLPQAQTNSAKHLKAIGKVFKYRFFFSLLVSGRVGRRGCSLKASVVWMLCHTGSGAVSLQGEIITQQPERQCVQRRTVGPTLQTLSNHLARQQAESPKKQRTVADNYLMEGSIWMAVCEKSVRKQNRRTLNSSDLHCFPKCICV